MSAIIDTCIKIGRPIVEGMGYSLVDVEFLKEGKNYILRFSVDSAHGIDLDECAIMSEKISTELDKEDPITNEYILEISSPGAERPLKSKEDIEKAVNKYVNVKLKAPVNGLSEYEGELQAFTLDVLTISYKEKTVTKKVNINYDQVAKIRLAIKF